MKVSITSGIYSDNDGEYRTAYPINLVPIAVDNGISNGYLKPASGIKLFCDVPGVDRGGINVRDVLYRVTGSKFIRVNRDSTIVVLGDVGFGNNQEVSLCYSFDNIGIASGGKLFYWNLAGLTLTEVTDVNLGVCLYVNWLDGYFVSTDGTNISASDINDPLVWNPLSYGSSEVLPDDIKSLLVLRNQLYALNRYSIEAFQNIGGQFFPFQRIDGAYIQRGTIGNFANCIFEERLAFIGGGQNESPAVWLGLNAQTEKISTREVDTRLQAFSESELSLVVLEARIDKDQRLLYMHLPNETLVYDAFTSTVSGTPIWYSLISSIDYTGRYAAINFVWAYDKWITGDPTNTRLGVLDHTIGSHYGKTIAWECSTKITYNDANGAIFNEIELVGLSGTVAPNTSPVIYTSYSLDNGITWSVPKVRTAGKLGQREKRLNWLQNGAMSFTRIQRFRGNSDAHLSFSQLEINLEPLYV